MSKVFEIIPDEKNSENFLNILPASSFVPEWYRKSNSSLKNTNSELSLNFPPNTNSTYKKCTPFFDALTLGYMIFLTADIEIIRKENNMPYIMFRTQRSIVTDHSLEQWEGVPCPHGYSSYLYKWHNQFTIKTPNNYSLLFTNPINRFDLPFQTITGLVDTDSFNMAVHFPFFINNSFSGIIEKGTPITQIIPIKRDSWKRKISDPEFSLDIRLDKYRSTIKRSYKNNHWFKKEYK